MTMWPGTSESGRSLLRESAGEKSSLECGDLSIELESREVRVRGHELQLSAEEFDLLVFLVGHATGIITPQTRLSTRWGRDVIHHSEVLRVLTQLRKKLEEMGCAHYIRTEPWVVYRFDPRSRDAIH